MSKRIPGIESLVANAIRQLQAVQGSTTKDITDYLAQQRDLAGPDFRRAVQLTIKRGLNYGILQRSKRGFVTCDRASAPELAVELPDGAACVGCKRTSCYGSRGRSRVRRGSRRLGKARRHASRARRRGYKRSKSSWRPGKSKSRRRGACGHGMRSRRSSRARRAARKPAVGASSSNSSTSPVKAKAKSAAGEEKKATVKQTSSRPRSGSKGPTTREQSGEQ